MRILIAIGLAAVVHISNALPTPQAATNNTRGYGRLIVFGDSFSDNGSGAWLVSNETWPADPAYFNHSFSNGPVWPDHVAEELGVQLLDYAVGGATADNGFIAGYTGPNSEILVPSAYEQLQHFLNTSSVEPTDIFVHFIGANDFFFNPNVTGAQITSLVNRDIDLLFRAGARTVLLANYPDVFPATVGVQAYDAIPEFVQSLTIGLENIVAGYSAYIDIGYVDVLSFFKSVEADPAAYGIDGEYLDPPTACLQGAYPAEGVARSVCDDPAEHFFWDIYHPVQEVHSRIAELFLDTLYSL